MAWRKTALLFLVACGLIKAPPVVRGTYQGKPDRHERVAATLVSWAHKGGGPFVGDTVAVKYGPNWTPATVLAIEGGKTDVKHILLDGEIRRGLGRADVRAATADDLLTVDCAEEADPQRRAFCDGDCKAILDPDIQAQCFYKCDDIKDPDYHAFCRIHMGAYGRYGRYEYEDKHCDPIRGAAMKRICLAMLKNRREVAARSPAASPDTAGPAAGTDEPAEEPAEEKCKPTGASVKSTGECCSNLSGSRNGHIICCPSNVTSCGD
jgi:hypothetical protein